MLRRTLSGLFVGRSLSKWYLKRSSKALTITSKGRRIKGTSVECDSVVLLSLAESSLKKGQILTIHGHYILELGPCLMKYDVILPYMVYRCKTCMPAVQFERQRAERSRIAR